MTDATSQNPAGEPPRAIAPCPWCGPGSKLVLGGDGMGGTFVRCTQCGCVGPAVAIGDDFATSDQQAIRRWAARPSATPRSVGRDLLERVGSSIAVQEILNGGVLRGTRISLSFEDLAQLLATLDLPEPLPRAA